MLIQIQHNMLYCKFKINLRHTGEIGLFDSTTIQTYKKKIKKAKI